LPTNPRQKENRRGHWYWKRHLKRLEPCAVKTACTVLRRTQGRNTLGLSNSMGCRAHFCLVVSFQTSFKILWSLDSE